MAQIMMEKEWETDWVMIPGYTAFLGLWLLAGTPPRAKINDNFGTANIGLNSSVGKSAGTSNQRSWVQTPIQSNLLCSSEIGTNNGRKASLHESAGSIYSQR